MALALFVGVLQFGLGGCLHTGGGQPDTKILRREPGFARMPDWFRRTPPMPDEQYRYFSGYSDQQTGDYDNAVTFAETNARARIGEFIGTQITKVVGSGTGSAYRRELWSRVRSSILRQSVESAEQLEQYWERVYREDGSVRYDLGVLMRYPESEVRKAVEHMETERAQHVRVERALAQAATWWEAGDREQAVEVMKALRRDLPGDDETVFRLGIYLLDVGDRDGALACFYEVASGDSEWKERARAKIRAILQKGPPSQGGGGQDKLLQMFWDYVLEGKLLQARKLARDTYAEGDGPPEWLWTWHMVALLDYERTKSNSSRYDVGKSRKLVDGALKELTPGEDLERVVLCLLDFVARRTGSNVSMSELVEVKNALSDTHTFTDRARSCAIITLQGRDSPAANDVLNWIRGKQ